jgi:hypothetical protein
MNSNLARSAKGLSMFRSALFIVTLLGAISAPTAQKAGSRKTFDAGQLRDRFAEAVGKDFEIVKDEFKQRSNASGGGTYWLVHVKPKHSGYFKFTYRYNYNDSLYSHLEREFSLNVGRKGCRRGPPYTGSYSRFCAGDTIIIPIVINGFTEHQFSLTSTEFTKEDDAAFERQLPDAADENLDRSAVSNTVAEYMRYAGNNSYKMLHRNGGYTLEAYATFEAQRPGRFNLGLGAAFEGRQADVSSDATGGVPIIIVSRETPVTLLASRHEVRGYSKGYDGREWVSSVSGDAFMTDLIILQPGDRISLKYYSTIRSREFERQERAGDAKADESLEKIPPPVIGKRPFAPQSEYDFTEWLVDYLPR